MPAPIPKFVDPVDPWYLPPLPFMGGSKYIQYARSPMVHDDLVYQVVERCSLCMGAGVLRHFNLADEPCPSCPPPRVDGPSEWTAVSRETRSEPLMADGSYSAEHVTVQCGQQVAVFRVVAHHTVDFHSTNVIRRDGKYAGEWGSTVLCVRGEANIDMAIARLLCGLRDGTVMA